MERHEVDELRDRVPCASVLEQAGFGIDEKESTLRAIKFRRGGEIIIVIHAGRGWFDPLSDAKGDVFKLVEHLDRRSFREALECVAELVGFEPAAPAWTRQAREREPVITVSQRWRQRPMPWKGSLTWRYLRDKRCIADDVIRAAIQQGRLREGPHGSMWAAHIDDTGQTTGWEQRGADWQGFASGGAKVLFRFGCVDATRLCVTEAAIDALSLADLERLPADSLYLSTGGGWAPATSAAIEVLAGRPGRELVAATDNNRQGEVFASRIAEIAADVQCAFERLRPLKSDWNDDLRAARQKTEGERRK